MHKRWVRSQKYALALQDGPDLTVSEAYNSYRILMRTTDFILSNKSSTQRENDPDEYNWFVQHKEHAPGLRSQLRKAIVLYWNREIRQEDLEKFQYALHGETLKKNWRMINEKSMLRFIQTTLAKAAPTKKSKPSLRRRSSKQEEDELKPEHPGMTALKQMIIEQRTSAQIQKDNDQVRVDLDSNEGLYD